MPEHCGCLIQNQLQDDGLSIGIRLAEEPPGQRAAGICSTASRGAHQPAEDRGERPGPGLGAQSGRADADGHEQRVIRAASQIEQLEALLLGERGHAGALEAFMV